MGVLDGKAAVVTGAGRGIGRGHCVHLAQAGAGVVVNDIDHAEAEKVVSELKGGGARAVAIAADIGSRAGAEELIELCCKEFGAIDIIVNNAGIVRDRSFLKMSDEEFNDVMRIHVGGTFWGSQAAARKMREQGSGGVIINTTSAAHMGNFGQVNYAGAKGAIASMTYTLALELARYGIRVNAISPSGSTRMSATYKGPDGKEVELPYIDPALNGPMVVFLCSDEGNYITGQVFGTGGDRIALLSQPRYGDTMLKPGGWTLEEIQLHFKSQLGNRLEPIGLMKRPYPFYDGVKPSAAKKR
ncbi:MAG: SDR family NAD(P)-dependent oxidoreductase [Deltaproteobacteria bacterium]|nr:SDR family NAD(P)-dependent oxidoreductase [Deltaproteobacteria bacterium]